MNLVLLAGQSGTGKSAIIKEFNTRICKKERNLLFVSGKFEQHSSTPYAAFISAFAQLCSDIQSLDIYPTIRDSIQEAVGTDYKLLRDIVPNIGELVDRVEEPDAVQDKDDEGQDKEAYDIVKSQQRFKFLLQRFLSAVCKPEHKLVFFLDDLQWIDRASLDLLEIILTDPGLKETVLVVCAYRDNEVTEQHSFSERMRHIQDMRKQIATTITIGNLSPRIVHDFITELLNMNPLETEELAKIAYEKVNGNVFFLIQFLTALRDGGYLEFNLGIMKWTWDQPTIRKSTMVSKNVLTILMDKMENLPESLKRFLSIAACLGASFEEVVIDLVAKGLEHNSDPESKVSTQEILEAIVQEGLLEQLPGRFDNRSYYCFAHDYIELAAHSLLDEDSIPQLKLQIGRILYKHRSQFDFQSLLFTVVDFWNAGQELVTEKEEAQLVINLNVQAGKKALESSAFEASTIYLRRAIGLIPQEKQWTEQYALSLDLYNSLLKAEYSNGSWERLHDDINIVLAQKDRPVLDKCVAYTTLITTLSSHQHKHMDAVALSVDVLSQLGVTFRPNLGKLAVVGSLIKTKRLLKKQPLEYLLDQVEMEDKNKIVALDIVLTMNSSSYASNPDLYICAVMKAVRWSLKYGISKHSSKCIAIYGLVDMALGNIEAGTKACKIALQLAEKQRLMASEFAPIKEVYGFVFPWTSPLHSCRNHLLTGYEIGLQRGDLEVAFINITLYCKFCFYSGKRFSEIEADMRDYGRQMRVYNMTLPLQFLSLTWQTILNLMGRNDDPLVLSGEVMNQEEMFQAADNDNNPPLRSQLQCHRLQLAVYFGDYELAAQLIGPASDVGKVNPANPIIWRTALFEGIAAFEMVRRGKRKWKGTALKAITKIQKWVQAGNVNCVHILFFLQAEKAALGKDNIEEARTLYDNAIATAARSGFRNDTALAYERCGGMFDRAGDEDRAIDYYIKAHELYSELEAFGKIDQMNRQRPSLVSSHSTTTTTRTIDDDDDDDKDCDSSGAESIKELIGIKVSNSRRVEKNWSWKTRSSSDN
jgi:predicted ATPase